MRLLTLALVLSAACQGATVGIFTLTDFTFHQSATGGAFLPATSQIGSKYYAAGPVVYLGLFTWGGSNPANDWQTSSGGSISLDWSFIVSCAAPFSVLLENTHYFHPGPVTERVSVNGSLVSYHADILGPQVFPGIAMQLVADVPEPDTSLLVGLSFLFLVIALAFKRSSN